MKKIGIIALIIPLVMLLIPLYSLKTSGKDSIQTGGSLIGEIQYNKPPSGAKVETFRLLDHKTGKISEISADDYIFGVLAAEMPALYEEEALKAQAVAAYTFACYKKLSAKDRKYDISTDYTVDQAYKTEEDARKGWGDNADKYVEKLKNVVKETRGIVVTYKGDIALTAYHSLSSGRTESAKDVWGKEVPYLVPVECAGDMIADNYLKKFEFSTQEFSEKLKSLCDFSGEPQSWIGKSKCTDSGSVIEIDICKKSLAGSKVRQALELPSCCFDISLSNDTFIVTTRGYGHGVGMSQNGANVLAKQGSNYEEILTWFYSNCTLEKTKN